MQLMPRKFLVQGAAAFGLALVVTGVAAAAKEWNSQWPWWCYEGSQSCTFWSGPDTYTGYYAVACDPAVIHTGWYNDQTVHSYCSVMHP